MSESRAPKTETDREPSRERATGAYTNPNGNALLVSELFPPAIGGSAVLFENVYARIPGVRTTVLTDTVTSPGPDGERRGDRLTVVRRPIQTRQWGLRPMSALGHHLTVAAEIRRLAAQGKRTVVHCGRALPEGTAAWLSRRGVGLGPRYIVWTHGEDIGSALTSRELTFVMKRVYAGASAIFANSQNSRRMLHELGVPVERTHVVYPGVDPDRFRPDVDGSALRARLAPAGETVLLTVGRLQRRKGHDIAIEAMARLKRELQGVRYVIVGDGAERARLEALVAEHKVGDVVQFEGEVATEMLPKYYAASDVFLMPNRIDGEDVEGFGIVFMEAQSTGRPVIGGNNGGVPEAVAHGQSGFLVSGTDADELAVVLRRLVSSRELRAELGAAGRARVLRGFTWERAADAVGAVHAAVAAAR